MKTVHPILRGVVVAGPRSRPYGLLAAFVFLQLLMANAIAESTEPGKGEYWRGVERVRGRVSIESRGGKDERNSYSHDTWDSTESVQVDFALERRHRKEPEMPPGLTPEIIAYMRGQWAQEEAASDAVIWEAAPNSVKVSMVSFQTNSSAYFPNEKQSTTRAEVNGVNLFELALELKIETGVWQLVSPGKLRDKYQIIHTGTERDMVTNESKSLDTAWEFDSVDHLVFDGTLAGKPGPVHGVTKIEEGGSPGNPTTWSTSLGKIEFWPEFVDAQVEVTIDGYVKWRPEGSITKPSEPGNHLVARGTLMPKGGGSVESLPKIKKFRFELLDTSSEPGVCLNWPLGAKDTDYDLRLASAGPMSQGQLSKKDQTNEVVDYLVDEKKRPYAETRIDSYDFGGKATLRVICELADGRELVGEMKGEGGGEPLIMLPKMSGPGWIAESWRKEKQAEKLADNDDDEKIEGQQNNGDGFTLHEEYRGWVANGQRLEGDPEEKDFFILNLIGGDAEPGIELFEELSKLKVHAKLRRSEMSAKTRLMNGNHRDAPQNKPQHGVWVKTFASKSDLGDEGAATVMNKKGVAGRPGLVNGVGILARDNTESTFNQPFNLPAQDAIFAYDRAIAHELLHSVGVEHHGPDDTSGYWFAFIPPNFPGGKVGRVHYLLNGDTVVNLLDEAQHDLAAQIYPVYVEVKQRMVSGGTVEMIENLYGTSFKDKPPGSAALKAFAEEYVDQVARAAFGKQGMVGKEHGAHSGNQDCVMRYYFAKFYDAKEAGEKTVYWVSPGTEHIGMEICHDRQGTGVNAAGRKPQSRYGDTAGTLGNCFGQICSNDAIPPRTTK
jgi:hypothetical protein